MKQVYEAQSLEMAPTFQKTKVLLTVYRSAYWSLTEHFEELEAYTYASCADGESVVNYMLTFAPDKQLQIFTDRVQNAAKSRLILAMIRKAVKRLQAYPCDGELYYRILYYTYLCQEKYSVDAILDLLNMERSTYYRKKKEAITLIGYILFGRIVPEFGKNPAL
jgi:hypothetical protein